MLVTPASWLSPSSISLPHIFSPLPSLPFLLPPTSPHPFFHEPRYWYAGRWQTNRQLYLALEIVRKQLPRDAVVCALAAVHGQVPCLHAPCVLTLHVRPYYSDFSVLKQLVEMDEFGFIKHFRPRTVLDAGANVGYATLIFSTFFPNATVVAIEASDKNFEVLRRNTYRLRNVYAVHAGLFNHSGMVLLRNGTQTKTREGWQYVVTPVPSNSSGDTNEGDTNEHVQEGVEGEAKSSNSSGVASTVAAEGGVTIRAVTVGDVLKQVGLARFDFVKMDIEGSEAEVLAMPPMASDSDVTESNADSSASGEISSSNGSDNSSSSSGGSSSSSSGGSSSSSSSRTSSTADISRKSDWYDPRPWLDEVRVMAVEVHDRMKPNCTVTVEAATVARQWRLLARSGEYLVLENERWSVRRGRRGGAAGQRAEDREKLREVQRKEGERRKEGTKEEGRVQQGAQAGSGEGQRGEVKARR
ncbi:unnamed protein product [Closterium sp. NIES-64]|nr:unnamed protein product [Closterium sp. NIES-64]